LPFDDNFLGLGADLQGYQLLQVAYGVIKTKWGVRSRSSAACLLALDSDLLAHPVVQEYLYHPELTSTVGSGV